MSGGLDSTGLTIELVSDIRAAIEADLRATFGASLPLGDKTVLGHIVGIVAEHIGLLWERLEQVYSSQDPDKATAAALDALAILTGTLRLAAIPSTVLLTLCGDPGTVIASGALVATTSTGVQFQTSSTATLISLAVWAPTSNYVKNDRVTNVSRCYECITAGTSAGSGGPTTNVDDITDGSAHWRYIGEGTAVDDVAATSVDTGTITAIAEDLTVIQTPVFGWSSVRNLDDATLGRDIQSDQGLRVLREAELSGNGESTADAIRAKILKLDSVTTCSVIVNNTDATDGQGRPPHSFEVLVLGGVDQEIVDTIGQQMPAGVQTYGTSSGTYIDTEGNSNTINFSHPVSVPIYLRALLTYNANLYPADGDTEIKAAIDTTAQETYAIDLDVDPSFIGAQAFQVPGVRGVQEVDVYTDVINAPAAWINSHAYVATVGARSVVSNDGGRAYICITAGTSAGSGGPTGTGTDITDGTVHWRWLGNPVVIDARSIATFATGHMTIISTAATP